MTNNTARAVEDLIAEAYTDGYAEAVKDITQEKRRKKSRHKRQQETVKTYTKQKLFGLAYIILGILCTALTKDITAAVLVIPLGVYVTATSEDLTR